MAALWGLAFSRQLALSAAKPTCLPIVTNRAFITTSHLRASLNNTDASSAKPRSPVTGSLGQSSIWEDEIDEDVDLSSSSSGPAPEKGSSEGQGVLDRSFPLRKRNQAVVQRGLMLDITPRQRWERKMVIRDIQRRGRLTKGQQILCTERQSLYKSPFFKTSVKKLMKLARQIAGKSLDDALLQMRFSPKKVAQDVKSHLEIARNQAIVANGMGFGRINGELDNFEPVTIITNDGTKRVVTDPSRIYIAQAWVNRGSYELETEFRARGRVNILRKPHTGFSVLLKEERTLIREARDREETATRKRRSQLWTPLPDRKINGQNQYYSW